MAPCPCSSLVVRNQRPFLPIEIMTRTIATFGFEICTKGKEEGGGAPWFYFYHIVVLVAQCCMGGLPAKALWVIRTVFFRYDALCPLQSKKYIHDEVIFGEKGISQLTPLLITNCPPNPSMIIQTHKLNKNTNHRFGWTKDGVVYRFIGNWLWN